MKHVAKLVIIDKDDSYLLMYRNQHPRFGDDPDLPGGTLEEGESPLETMIREVEEEAGITLEAAAVEEVYSGTDYSPLGTHYSLFVARFAKRPGVMMSWEHVSYEWLGKEAFLQRSKSANDTFMHMVYEVLK